MKKKYFLSIFYVLSIACLTMINVVAHAAPVYAQLTSTDSQLVASSVINKPLVVNIKNIADISGMTWDKNNNTLTILEDGIYTIFSSVQCGARESVSLKPEGGDIYYWIEANGLKIPNSANTVHISPKAKSSYIISYYMGPLSKGTVLRFMFSSTIEHIGLVTFRGTEVRPDAPGFGASVWKVGDI